jgi:hypothetical protein
MALSTGEVIICFIVNVYHADVVACVITSIVRKFFKEVARDVLLLLAFSSLVLTESKKPVGIGWISLNIS